MWKKTIFVICMACIYSLLQIRTKKSCPAQGYVIAELESIKDEFRKNLAKEVEGMALAVYHNDELVVDLWGGYAEKDAMRSWESDTLTITFSSGKLIGAMIIAILVSRNQLEYEALVTKYWPEFGANGKENITVQWIMEHKAGLIKFAEDIPLERANEHEFIAEIIEKTTPIWIPGSKVGYHGITYGWLIDQLVRHSDPNRRGIRQFYEDEILPFMKDKDYYIGLPTNEHHRVARIVQPSLLEITYAMLSSMHYIIFAFHAIINGGTLIISSVGTPKWMSVLNVAMPYNNPKVREVENIATNSIATARGFASVVSTILKEKMISEKIWKRLSKPTNFEGDICSFIKMPRGHGFFYNQHPLKSEEYLLSHIGHGMQKIIFDPKGKIVVALLRNKLQWSLTEDYKINKITREIILLLSERSEIAKED